MSCIHDLSFVALEYLFTNSETSLAWVNFDSFNCPAYRRNSITRGGGTNHCILLLSNWRQKLFWCILANPNRFSNLNLFLPTCYGKSIFDKSCIPSRRNHHWPGGSTDSKGFGYSGSSFYFSSHRCRIRLHQPSFIHICTFWWIASPI